ncbi:Peptidyl-prolyl cis-trans isomerase (rotamase)-cyclophilin family [Psychroflexus sediminis]|uniref:Peptidyl-prolyl cis-trans isomerase n=2 Tax=Psychroflexus sediminis TaxID=470826 RepID=A0A1G7XHV8_9FLAO|nr:Peptidyl-prolyl cis-trans isomerase (rotamase)-cyclophilin family [Psychroflexus sediminis]
MMKNPFFFLCLLVAFIACKENKDNSTTKSEVKKDTIVEKVEVQIPSNGKTDRDLSQIEFVEQEELIPFLKAYGENNPETIVDVETEFGTFTIELFPEPILHRANFLRLAKLGYFDTSVFHRVDSDFVVQGGNSDRMATHQFRRAVGDYLIPNESISKYPHDYGMVSAAKYAEQNVSNASSPFEFFVVTKPDGAYHLDGKHTVFGRIIDGMEVIEKIDDLETDDSEWPLKNVGMDMKVVR